MNIRQKYELKILSNDGYMDMQKTAELFSISLRTVRYDIQILNEYLMQELGKECITVSNKMALMKPLLSEESERLSDLSVKDFYADRISAEERMFLILFDLCWISSSCTIQSIADKYFVSRATVNKDIIAVKNYCRQNGIVFVSGRGKGIGIEADEFERRRCMARIIRDMSALKEKDAHHTQSMYSQWFEDRELEKIREIVADAEEMFDIYLADIAYEALVVHIGLSIERFRTNRQYDELPRQLGTDKVGVQYRMAVEIIKQINETFQICLPEAELYYVAMHIGAKSSEVIKKKTAWNASLEYYCIRLIAEVSRQIDWDLTNDEHLYESLLQHMNVCIYRKQSGMFLENPLKVELMHSYPYLFQVIEYVLKSELDPEIIIASEDEIAYILLHFAAALYRRQQNQKRLADVVVVCATGIGTSELVVAGLRRSFQMNIVGTVAMHQLNNFLKKQDADLIITTVPLKTTRSYIRVSPLLKQQDIVNIGKNLLDMGFDIVKPIETGTEWSDTAKQVKRLLETYPAQDQEETLRVNLFTALQKKNQKKEKQYMLSELLTEQTIRLEVSCTDWEDCVRKSGEPLLQSEMITQEYIQAVIDSAKEAGPYFVITKGVALPHATNKAGVQKTAISFVRLKTPVAFGNKSNDPVEYVFMLATTDADSHLGALQDLSELLEREEFMAVLRKANTSTEIISYILDYESKRSA